MNHRQILELVVRDGSVRLVLAATAPGRVGLLLQIELVGLVERVVRVFVDFDYMMGKDDGVSGANTG